MTLLQEELMTKPRFIFQPGDRVVERGKNDALFAVRDEIRPIVERNRQIRRGTVVGLTAKVNVRKQTTSYVQVLWDNFKTPSEHASMRLNLLPNE
jgi:hypothetical protein